MRSAYSIILAASSWMITACISSPSLSPVSGLGSLREENTYQLVQVAANFDTSAQRSHPYFVVCKEPDCSVVTAKTPLQIMPIAEANTMPDHPVHDHQKGKTIHGINTTYLTKKPILLEQFRVHFSYASEDLSETYRKRLKQFVTNYPHQNNTIRVTGYTDSDSTPGGKIGNEWLALERAASVKKHLITLGYPETQILLEAKFLCCYLDSNETVEGRQRNRRAEITLLNVK